MYIDYKPDHHTIKQGRGMARSLATTIDGNNEVCDEKKAIIVEQQI